MTLISLTITSIAKSTIGKIIYPIVYVFQLKEVAQQSTLNNQSFVDSLLQNIPAQVMTYLAIAYGVILVGQRWLKFWKSYKLDRIQIKKAQEDLERDEMDTIRKQNELKK